jgi:SSS family solute:Na+ symporter
MSYLTTFDYAIIGLYFLGMLALGLYFQRQASKNMNAYFLAEKGLPWWMLGISGMGYSLDLTGTMLIISLLYIFGPRGLFIEFRGGLSLAMICQMIWTGKWHRRSGCMTIAEWMSFRFGTGSSGHFARVATAVAFIVFTAAMLTYLAVGSGLFMSLFIPLTPFQCAVLLIGVATISTMMSGFYGVVYSDLFQCGLIVLGIAVVTVLAIVKMDEPAVFTQMARTLTNCREWADSFPAWRVDVPKGYEQYQQLLLYTMGFLVLNKLIIGGFGTGHEPQFFAARNERECGLLACMWSVLMTLRWPFMIGFVILGLYLVRDFFPDMGVLAQATALIKQHVTTDAAQWREVLARIKLHPDQYPDVVAGLQNLLGAAWTQKIELLSFDGTLNAERIAPSVLLYAIPNGLRGLIFVALLAASTSTFNVTVNKASAIWTNDLYKGYIRPGAKTRELLFSTYGFCIVLVALSFSVGYLVPNINSIWGWITMGLWSGIGMPMLLRFYWGRFNGTGFATSMFGGMAAAIAILAYNTMYPAHELSEVTQFLILTPVSLICAVIGTYLGAPTPHAVLQHFYHVTRPFGLWGDLANTLAPAVRSAMHREHRNDMLALPFAFVWMVTMYLCPMQFMIGQYQAGLISLGLFLASLVGLYWFWYRPLPAAAPAGGEPHAAAARPAVQEVVP